MSGTVWAVGWAVVVGGGWVANNVRGALRTRHERTMERAAAEDARRKELAAAGRPPEPVCGCGHHLAKHDKQGKCHEPVEAAVEWDEERRPLRYEARPCDCQQYVGPQPLTTLYAQDLTDLD